MRGVQCVSVNAVVFPSGLRKKIEWASHYGWRPGYGEIPRIKTDANGIAEIAYPKYIQEKVETGTVTWSVEHPDFVPFREDWRVDDDPADIKLERGYRIAVTAVDSATGKKITNDLYAVICGFNSREWKLYENGTLVSPVFSTKQQTGLRIVQITNGKPALFSRFIDVEAEGKSRVLLKDVKLSKGIRIEGKLDAKVPRPVKNGGVSVAACMRSAPQAYKSQWNWSDHAPIGEDGSFVIESFPPDEIIQLLPYCDGWLPTKPTVELVAKYFPADGLRLLDVPMTKPQLFEPDCNPFSLELDMQETTSVKVIVLDPNGDPLPNATVSMGPNHVWFQGAGSIIGMDYSTRESLVLTRQDNKHQRRPGPMRFISQSDENGVAIISNLPVFDRESIQVYHKDFDVPITAGRRTVRVDLKADKVTEVTVKMRKKGSEVLDEKAR